MPLAKSLSHRTVGEPNLPYISNNSPTSTQNVLATGSSDILTQIIGWAQRRPGFSDSVETTPTVFNNLQRLYEWERFDGTIILMACDINNLDQAVVYKYQVGTDTSFQAILTDTVNTGTPYDFVSSNNTAYFSNGFTKKKWDPINGLSNWGITASSGAGGGTVTDSKYCGTATDTGANIGGTNVPWTNVTNMQGAPDTNYATVNLTGGGVTGFSNLVDCTNYGFAIGSTNTVNGIAVSVTIKVFFAGVPIDFFCQLLKGGVPTGVTYGFTVDSASPVTITLGSGSDLWGDTWSSANINDTTFGVEVNCNEQVSIQTVSVDAVQISVYSTPLPGVTVSGSAGTMSATVGYQYVVCYGNSLTGHISSPGPYSASTGIFANKLNVAVTVIASTDPQVNQIRVFRTTDSATGLGGQNYFEIPNSPFPNTTGSILDNATDRQLNINSIAPTPGFNDPPPLWQGMQYYAGRIWGYVGNKVWFTGLEEIINGVPEESVPSGVAGNFYSFDQPVMAIGTAGIDENQKLLVFCPGRIYSIQGTTLDTFRRRKIADRRGCRNRTCVTMMGGVCAWLDTASQVWATDGTSIEELSIDIRPDIVGINQLASSMSFHVAGNSHWMVLSNGEQLFVYDIDSEHWMPPWTFSCQYVYSAETSPGSYSLMAAKPTKALKLNVNAFNDDGATYAPVLKTNLFSLIPDTPGVSDDPSRSGAPWYVEVDTNDMTLADVSYIADEDPETGTYTSINRDKSVVETTFNRKNGVDINQQIYPLAGRPSCRWFAFKVTMQSVDRMDIIYDYDVAFTVIK